MTLDFSGQNLCGRSFKDQNLEGANFSGADIRGTDLTNANLKDTNFAGSNAGLQTRWLLGLLFSLLVLSILSSLLPLVMTGAIKYIFQVFSNTEAIFITSFDCLVITFLLFIAIRKGLFSASIASVAVVILTLFVAWMLGANGADARINAISAAAIAIVVIGTITAVVTTGIFAFVSAATFSISGLIAFSWIAIITSISGVGIASAAYTGIVAFTVTALAIGAFILSGAYIGWRTLNGDKRDAWIRPIAIAFAAIRGTNFRGADLTDANFTGATLKSTDFRKANLTRTCWRNAKKLDRIRPGTTYLQNEQVRQLVITGEGKNKNFDRLDLRGLNLREADLKNASFIGADFSQANLEKADLENASLIDADFYQANLQKANLSRAILVRTNFERADLRGACLTGSCIQDWTISRETKLAGIVCDCVYLKWVDGDKRDQMPPRDKFKKGGFVLFAKYILDTIDIYHNKDINPRLALTVLKKMSRDYHEPLDIVAIGKRGDKVFIKVKLSETIEPEQFKEDYFSRYKDDLKLTSSSSKVLPSVDELIENRIAEIASEKSNEISSINVTHIEYLNTPKDIVIQGEVTVETIKPGGDNFNLSGSFGVGVNKGEIQAEKIAGTINEAQQGTLAEAAAEIQALLEQLQKSYPTDTTSGKMAIATETISQIDSNPALAARILSALKAGGVSAFEQLLNHPAASFVIGALEDWQKTKGG